MNVSYIYTADVLVSNKIAYYKVAEVGGVHF